MTEKMKTSDRRLTVRIAAASIVLAAAVGCHHIPTSRPGWGTSVGEYSVNDEQAIQQWRQAAAGSGDPGVAEAEQHGRFSFFKGLFKKDYSGKDYSDESEGLTARLLGSRGKKTEEPLPSDSNLFPADRYDTPKLGRIVPIKKAGENAVAQTGQEKTTPSNERTGEQTDEQIAQVEEFPIPESPEMYLTQAAASTSEAGTGTGTSDTGAGEMAAANEVALESIRKNDGDSSADTMADTAADTTRIAAFDSPPLPPAEEPADSSRTSQLNTQPIATVWGNNPAIQSVAYFDQTLSDSSPSMWALHGTRQDQSEQLQKSPLPQPDMEAGFEMSLEHLPGNRGTGAQTAAVSPDLDTLLTSKTAAAAAEPMAEPAPVPAAAEPVAEPVKTAATPIGATSVVMAPAAEPVLPSEPAKITTESDPTSEPVASLALTDLGQGQASGSIAFADNAVDRFTNSARELCNDARPISHEEMLGNQSRVSPIAMDTNTNTDADTNTDTEVYADASTDTALGMIGASPLGTLSRQRAADSQPGVNSNSVTALPPASGSWRDDVHRAVDRLREEIDRQAAEGTLRPMEAARLRLLMLAVGDSTNSAAKIASTNPTLHSFWDKQLNGLRILLDSSGEGPTLEIAERELDESLSWLRTTCPAKIKKALLVQESASFGLYVPHDGGYAPGEKAHVYLELGNISSYPVDQEYEIAVQCRWELYDAQNQLVLPASEQLCASRSSSSLEDIVLNIPVTLPPSTSRGDYRLLVSVRDHHSRAVAETRTELVVPMR